MPSGGSGRVILRAHPPRRIAEQLDAADHILAEGGSLADAARKLGVNYQTLYSRIRRYATRKSGAERLAELERDNAALREALMALDIDPDAPYATMLVQQHRHGKRTRAQVKRT